MVIANFSIGKIFSAILGGVIGGTVLLILIALSLALTVFKKKRGLTGNFFPSFIIILPWLQFTDNRY